MALVEPVPLVEVDALGGVHFIAVGGAGMSGIAAAYVARGVAVSGSDQADSGNLRQLAAEGIAVHVGHDPAQLGTAGTVVVSSAVRETNVELAEARRRGLRVWHRSAALGALMLGRRGVAISGTHGKTTTTGMTAEVLTAVGADPSYVIGSPLASTGHSSHLGAGEAFVVEADESDGSFLQYPAEVVAITNIEADHLDNWGTAEAYFDGFAALVRQPGVRTVVLSADDPGTRALRGHAEGDGRRVVTFGESPDAEVRLTDLVVDVPGASATLHAPGDTGALRLAVPGRYNLHNAAAAYAIGRALGLDGAQLRAAALRFHGTHRRFSFVGELGGARLYDDYAHHPTEVRALLAAARPLAGAGRLVACFQPHLFSRTRDFAVEFGAALAAADEVIVLDVYPAREDPIPGVTGALVADAARAAGAASVHYVADRADAPRVLAGLLRPGDLALTIGAGDVTAVGPAALEVTR
ncbi:UDP-N-acetylmuramate--L-alanine ligase [Micropruina sonneratiae]|uniref:UDP-N-acetylmuramate--L-alanine ligase n=1 Tax=Micropruina sonneratiae TaxID=2986940 RepID=UPI002226AD40|nr:UDP-N-acetylmuramate--L-alanine ligase [Micropruina sp. KQZ13P-5]MCW3157144.1 UDP-N-acetylmuramate--L-alanine ligase [Micropruina sp. KQZ13P-5]